LVKTITKIREIAKKLLLSQPVNQRLIHHHRSLPLLSLFHGLLINRPKNERDYRIYI
jgi:hypothetical protein